jgi:DnaJ-domain-containing protein 1
VNEDDASEALRKMDRYELDGRELSIVLAKDRRKTPAEMRPKGRRDRSRSRSPRRDRDRSPRRDDRRRVSYLYILRMYLK